MPKKGITVQHFPKSGARGRVDWRINGLLFAQLWWLHHDHGHPVAYRTDFFYGSLGPAFHRTRPDAQHRIMSIISLLQREGILHNA